MKQDICVSFVSHVWLCREEGAKLIKSSALPPPPSLSLFIITPVTMHCCCLFPRLLGSLCYTPGDVPCMTFKFCCSSHCKHPFATIAAAHARMVVYAAVTSVHLSCRSAGTVPASSNAGTVPASPALPSATLAPLPAPVVAPHPAPNLATALLPAQAPVAPERQSKRKRGEAAQGTPSGAEAVGQMEGGAQARGHMDAEAGRGRQRTAAHPPLLSPHSTHSPAKEAQGAAAEAPPLPSPQPNPHNLQAAAAHPLAAVSHSLRRRAATGQQAGTEGQLALPHVEPASR